MSADSGTQEHRRPLGFRCRTIERPAWLTFRLPAPPRSGGTRWTVHTAVCLTLVASSWYPDAGLAEEPATSDWHYGGSVDLNYAIDFNFPENNAWRTKTTTPSVNEPALNMAVGYGRKDATFQSRWGLEFGLQEGNDTEGLVPPSLPGRDKPVGHAEQLKHFSRANVSYLAPVGNGLTLTAGLFNSYIGYQSFYSRYNLNYTRSYMADYAPYFMFGLGATYRVDEAWKAGFYVIKWVQLSFAHQ